MSDVGGTHIRVAAFDVSTLALVAQKKILTQGHGLLPTERLVNAIANIGKVHEIKAIAIAVPGFLDPEKGMIIEAPNIPNWINLPLRDIIKDYFKVPVFIGNDANLAALGEWKFGAGIGHKNILYLTISTGIGSGVIIDNHLLQGERGLAAEFGHVTILPDGPICGCGKPGHIEALSSGTAIGNYVRDQIALGRNSSLNALSNPSGSDIYDAAINGDDLAIESFSRAGKYLGLALANFLHMLNPSIVIFGGGVSQAGELLFKPMRDSLEDAIISKQYLQNLIITTAKLGDDVGLKGALALLLSKYQSPEIFTQQILFN
ncbi:MAG: ROK family protein [Anaerolineaceae bacterium]